MAERIEVKIRIEDYPDGWVANPAMLEAWVVGKLKDAGVPVEGTLVFRGIKEGTLHRLDDPKDFDVTKYVWVP
jgi:hypothetical protein